MSASEIESQPPASIDKPKKKKKKSKATGVTDQPSIQTTEETTTELSEAAAPTEKKKKKKKQLAERSSDALLATSAEQSSDSYTNESSRQSVEPSNSATTEKKKKKKKKKSVASTGEEATESSATPKKRSEEEKVSLDDSQDLVKEQAFEDTTPERDSKETSETTAVGEKTEKLLPLEPSEPVDPSTISKQGWLEKKGVIRHNWKKRWFVLQGHEMRYYQSEKDLKPKGVISLVNADFFPNVKRQGTLLTNYFNVRCGGRDFLIRCEDMKSKEEWVSVIKAHLKKEKQPPVVEKQKSGLFVRQHQYLGVVKPSKE